MGSKAELACVYSALILADDDVAITVRWIRIVLNGHEGEKIQTILKAASVDVEPYWPGLFAKALEGINVKDLITNVGSRAGGGTAPRGGNAPVSVAVTEAAPAEKKEEAKKKEESEESDDDMGFGRHIDVCGLIDVEIIITDERHGKAVQRPMGNLWLVGILMAAVYLSNSKDIHTGHFYFRTVLLYCGKGQE
ncbi:hypothetical protein Cfor_07033 [Coptotermes formosanus]|uniref:Large ribosomal subunit protein P1 n=1 Tax=Coptotermes formosanus TaxID=36987 RepID=A0A6L2Q1V6_COPFO|nr:hypothetical protein Cfor_07033 [Coptotermes formosanus]